MTQVTTAASRIIVGLSGGVDSSISAYLLKKAGYHVEAIFMKNWEGDDTDTHCPAKKDIEDAQAICDQLGIELHLVNFADRYWESVFTHFLEEYKAGRTPNPDILCNKEIKFRAFLDYAKQRGADYIATGHYVQTQKINEQTFLLKGNDPQKDQSYFLHALDATQLSQSLFPVGGLLKKEVRKLAANLNFKNAVKKDSTGICFIGERKFKTFLNEYLPAQPGVIETLEGKSIGKHDGLMFYTHGQRQGLWIGGQKNKPELPWYVAGKDLKRNVLTVVQGENHPVLFRDTLTTRHIHWINTPPQTFPFLCSAKTRYRQPDQACSIEKINDDHFLIKFAQPQRAITPGQSVVFYQDNLCLGGGMID